MFSRYFVTDFAYVPSFHELTQSEKDEVLRAPEHLRVGVRLRDNLETLRDAGFRVDVGRQRLAPYAQVDVFNRNNLWECVGISPESVGLFV